MWDRQGYASSSGPVLQKKRHSALWEKDLHGSSGRDSTSKQSSQEERGTIDLATRRGAGDRRKCENPGAVTLFDARRCAARPRSVQSFCDESSWASASSSSCRVRLLHSESAVPAVRLGDRAERDKHHQARGGAVLGLSPSLTMGLLDSHVTPSFGAVLRPK